MNREQQAQVVGRLVRDYSDRAYQFAYRLTGNMEQSRDLVQEAFYRVLKNWSQYDTAQPVENWFFTILRHLFLDGAKRYDRTHVVSLDAPVGGENEDEESFSDILEAQEEALLEALERKESGQAVRRALDRLCYEHKAVLTLCDLEGMPYEKIARVLDCPLGTVRSRVNRARGALRKLLLDEEGAKK